MSNKHDHPVSILIAFLDQSIAVVLDHFQEVIQSQLPGNQCPEYRKQRALMMFPDRVDGQVLFEIARFMVGGEWGEDRKAFKEMCGSELKRLLTRNPVVYTILHRQLPLADWAGINKKESEALQETALDLLVETALTKSLDEMLSPYSAMKHAPAS